MTQPVKKKEDGSYWVSLDFHLEELRKCESRVDDEKRVTSYYKDINKELKKENDALRREIVEILKS